MRRAVIRVCVRVFFFLCIWRVDQLLFATRWSRWSRHLVEDHNPSFIFIYIYVNAWYMIWEGSDDVDPLDTNLVRKCVTQINIFSFTILFFWWKLRGPRARYSFSNHVCLPANLAARQHDWRPCAHHQGVAIISVGGHQLLMSMSRSMTSERQPTHTHEYQRDY